MQPEKLHCFYLFSSYHHHLCSSSSTRCRRPPLISVVGPTTSLSSTPTLVVANALHCRQRQRFSSSSSARRRQRQRSLPTSNAFSSSSSARRYQHHPFLPTSSLSQRHRLSSSPLQLTSTILNVRRPRISEEEQSSSSRLKKVSLKATIDEVRLGCEDFDNRLVNHFIREFKQRVNIGMWSLCMTAFSTLTYYY